MTEPVKRMGTLLEAVRASLIETARHNPGDATAPASILWTDSDGQWKPLVELLRPLMPELLTLGEYNPEERVGPAIWLRCLVEPSVRERSFEGITWPAEAVPVVYMPGVSRQLLRATEDCPSELRPIVELQYRGVTWKQRNGRDWTIEAFLVSSDGGLGLDVARDAATKRSMQGSLSRLSLTPTANLTGRHLEAEDFNLLMVGDPVRELLNWMSNPSAVTNAWDDEKWTAFRDQCRQDYGFDPEKDGELVAAERLGIREGAWMGVWQRFAESPGLYPGIPDLLRQATPAGLFFDPEPWPSEMETRESSLRASLIGLADESASVARNSVRELEKEHAERREWVWAQLEMCPLAFALAHLAVLAEVTGSNLGGESIDQMARQHLARGQRADDAVVRAIGAVSRSEDVEAVSQAIRAMYLSWLEDSAVRFQQLLLAEADYPAAASPSIELISGDCLLFVDGLRHDLGERLALLAEERGAEVTRSWRWAALPTVTATAKPSVTPVADNVSRKSNMVADFTPQYGTDRKPLTTERLRKSLQERGIEGVDDSMLRAPLSADSIGWAEIGQFDKLGHELGLRLAQHAEEQLAEVINRALDLLEAGWKRVRVVTDHGWLLMPGGLEPISLPQYLTDSRWARCAAIKDTSLVEVPVFGWSWNPNERFATAPGAHAFRKNVVYAHGGVSLQECLVPDLTISISALPGTTARIDSATWAGLRCRVAITPAMTGVRADVRTRPNDASSSVTLTTPFDAEGKASLLVENEDLQGSAACAVVLDRNGSLIAQISTVIGGDG